MNNKIKIFVAMVINVLISFTVVSCGSSGGGSSTATFNLEGRDS